MSHESRLFRCLTGEEGRFIAIGEYLGKAVIWPLRFSSERGVTGEGSCVSEAHSDLP